MRARPWDLLLLGGVFLIGFSSFLLVLHYGRMSRIRSAIEQRSPSILQSYVNRPFERGTGLYWLDEVADELYVSREGELEALRSQLEALKNPEIRLMNLAATAICGIFGVVSIFTWMVLPFRNARDEPSRPMGRRLVILTVLSCALSGAITITEVTPRKIVRVHLKQRTTEAIRGAAIWLRVGTEQLADPESVISASFYTTEGRLALLFAADMCLFELYRQADDLPLLLRWRVSGEIRRYFESINKRKGDDKESFQAEMRRISHVARRIEDLR